MIQTNSPDNATYDETFRVRAYEAALDMRATLQHICNYFQEAAGNHASLLGFGYDVLSEKSLMWVLTRLIVKMDRYPKIGQTVTVRTWPSRADRLHAYRDYLLLDEQGNILGRASSAWAILDTENHRPIPVPSWVTDSRRLDLEDALVIPKAKPPVLPNAQPAFERNLTVRVSDIDVNQHANNTAYAGWTKEPIPTDIWVNNHPVLLDIIFRLECRQGESVISRAAQLPEDPEYPGGLQFAHSIIHAENRRELCRARTVWVPRGDSDI